LKKGDQLNNGVGRKTQEGVSRRDRPPKLYARGVNQKKREKQPEKKRKIFLEKRGKAGPNYPYAMKKKRKLAIYPIFSGRHKKGKGSWSWGGSEGKGNPFQKQKGLPWKRMKGLDQATWEKDRTGKNREKFYVLSAEEEYRGEKKTGRGRDSKAERKKRGNLKGKGCNGGKVRGGGEKGEAWQRFYEQLGSKKTDVHRTAQVTTRRLGGGEGRWPFFLLVRWGGVKKGEDLGLKARGASINTRSQEGEEKFTSIRKKGI